MCVSCLHVCMCFLDGSQVPVREADWAKPPETLLPVLRFHSSGVEQPYLAWTLSLLLKCFKIIFVCVWCVCTCHGMHVEDRGPFVGVGFSSMDPRDLTQIRWAEPSYKTLVWFQLSLFSSLQASWKHIQITSCFAVVLDNIYLVSVLTHLELVYLADFCAFVSDNLCFFLLSLPPSWWGFLVARLFGTVLIKIALQSSFSTSALWHSGQLFLLWHGILCMVGPSAASLASAQ